MEWYAVFHLTSIVKYLMKSLLKNDGMKLTVKILLIVMMPTFCQNGGGGESL